MPAKKVQLSLALSLAASIIILLPVFAQEGSGGWSPPEKIFETSGRLTESSMALVADRAGQLHLFFPHKPTETESAGIDYMIWNGSEWTDPTTVILNEDGSNVSNVRATIDRDQIIHVVWAGGGNTVYHAASSASVAGSARSWSVPHAIAKAITEVGIAVDQDSIIYVAYADSESPGNLMVAYSTDNGGTWSLPSLVATTQSGTVPGEVGVAVDETGLIHVTWTGHTLPSGSPLTGVYYARSEDGGLTWSAPLQVDDDRHGEIGVGTVGKDEIHLVWRSNIGGDGTFHQWSSDGGATWNPPDVRADGGGQSGLPTFATDSTGSLHFVTGPGYVASWENNALSPYVDVVGQELRAAASNDPAKSPGERAVIAITTGNQLHVVFETNFNKLWHTQKLLDIPEIAPQPLPVPEVVIAADVPTPEASFQPTTTPERASADVNVESPAFDVSRSQPTSSMALTLAISVVPVMVLVGVVMLIRTRRTLR